jgi:hypothetical protein
MDIRDDLEVDVVAACLGGRSLKGHVGAPVSANDVKLVSVEEMGYSVKDVFHGRE